MLSKAGDSPIAAGPAGQPLVLHTEALQNYGCKRMSLLKRLFGGHHGGHRPNGGHHGRRHGDAHDRAQAGIPSNPWPTTCLGCGSIASQRAQFCPQCGKSLAGVVCGQCGSAAQPGAKFCAECGTAL
ncbi:zinc ribbon domain-containing protein [Ralstonia holmesii]|uniref:zinc ribbon domain-containing protein n=2 Tax=Ralstonia TaxID=48736 RepID=UPI00292F8193|nr:MULTISPECIES: zinc ribbon domain-containing protein [Ralstonia]